MSRLSWSDILTAVRYPRRAAVEFYGMYLDYVWDGPDGIDIMEQDWDNLIILDACRYDVFSEVNPFRGNLRSVISRGSDTSIFFQRNFAGGCFPSTVYVCANPVPSQMSARFFDVVRLWEQGWNDEYHTVLPETVVDETIAAFERHSDKRIISHFMQPHYPWIGPQGREFHVEFGYTSLREKENIWVKMRRGDIPEDRVWEVYKENLEVVLESVKTLVEELPGKTVVTSDHGNAFGEMSVYGHPERAYIEPLIKVPWLELDGGSRRHIDDGGLTIPVDGSDDVDDVEERLAQLGYID